MTQKRYIISPPYSPFRALCRHLLRPPFVSDTYRCTAFFRQPCFPNAAILQLFASMGLHIDASSGHEVRRALAAGVPAASISLSTQELPDFFEELVEQGVKVNLCSVSQVERFTRMCGASIPEVLLDRLRPVQEDAGAVMATGIEWAITQCRDLLEAGAPGIHFYTLNKSHATRSILAALR